MKTASGRMTKQRRIILETLRGTHTHPTAEDLYMEVRKLLPHISLGTVYRNLDVLVAAGEISQLSTSGTVRRFDGNMNPHAHVHCLRCGRIGDVSTVAKDHVGVEQIRAEGFEITDCRLEFFGYCHDCAGRS